MFETFVLDALAFHEAIIQPAFADIIPTDFNYKGTLNEFTLMDNVPASRPIIDIRRHQNILQRRDASCDLVYKKVFGATTRKITTEEVYGATKFCRSEFYKGCLKEFRNNDPLFGNKILPYFQQAIMTDVAVNSYFGDVDRVEAQGLEWGTTIFDGIFKWVDRYVTADIIPAAQTFTIADGEDFVATPDDALALLKEMYEAQSSLMRAWPKADKAFYVTQGIADGYVEYLKSIGYYAAGISLQQDGIDDLRYNGIQILVEPLWDSVIAQLKGAAGDAAILTIRGNFIFATDAEYGEGEDGKTALNVWYSMEQISWVWQLFLKAGTGIALPEFIVVAKTAWT